MSQKTDTILHGTENEADGIVTEHVVEYTLSLTPS